MAGETEFRRRSNFTPLIGQEAKRERRDEGEAADYRDDADDETDKQRGMSGQCAGRRRHDLLRQRAGTGLGLPIVRGGEAMGGTITAANHLGSGAVFTLVLPIPPDAVREVAA
jgi:hypothetical protein